MNKRQRKKKQKKIQTQVIERLEELKERFKSLDEHKYMSHKGIQYLFDKLIDDVNKMK